MTSEQSSLSDFATDSDGDSDSEGDSYRCEICERKFDSTKGRGIHRTQAHSDQELRNAMREELRRLADEAEVAPTQKQLNQVGRFSAKAYQNKFGSWNEAVRAADLRVNEEYGIAETDLLDDLRRLQEETGETPTSRDVAEDGRYSASIYSRKFDSWNAAIQKAGLDVSKQREVPREDLKDELLQLADNLGQLPTAGQMEQQGSYSINPYEREFGSWNEALVEVFDEINRERDVPKEALLDELARLEAVCEGTPTSVDMERDGKYDVSTYAGEFGSWNEALRAAGYEPVEQRNIPRSALLSEIERLAEEDGQPPTAVDMEQDGRFSWSIYRRRFGSWNEAVRETGLAVNVRSDIPKPELKDELLRLRDQLGHTPERREMDEQGQFDSTTYATRFGSWNEALVAVGMSPNKILCPDDLNHIVRSRWELEVANILSEADVDYEYEPVKITYGDDRTYTPDFATDDYVIEVKGYIYSNASQKAVAARAQIESREYVVIGTELPADIHIPWEARHEVKQLF